MTDSTKFVIIYQYLSHSNFSVFDEQRRTILKFSNSKLFNF